MKKVFVINALVFVAALILIFTARVNQLSAASNFSSVQVFGGAGGFVKFFDKSTGRIYLYNKDLTECVSIVQLEELGLPAKVIKAGNSSESY